MKDNLSRQLWHSLCVALLISNSGLTAFATDIPALVRAAKPAVVELSCYDQDGELIKSGTGFFISADGILLTNYHLLKGDTYRISAKTITGELYSNMRILSAANESQAIEQDVVELQFDDARGVRLSSTRFFEESDRGPTGLGYW